MSRDHVLRGVALGIAQIGHGKKGGLQRMTPGDHLVYYSPRESLGDGAPLQAFTAIGRVADDEVWQADEGDVRPWRRRVVYDTSAVEAPIRPLIGVLELTQGPSWGVRLRRGLLEVSPADFALIANAMGSAT